MKLNQLERFLDHLEGFTDPSPVIEQYPTPPSLAARLLFHAALKGDVTGRRVCDLGCGTGILGIGAALLGAREVVGVEIDRSVLAIAKRNADRSGVVIRFLHADVSDPGIRDLIGPCDTVIMNPPFGAQQPHADRPFLDVSLTMAPVVYAIFNAGSRPFISSYLAERAEIEEVIGGLLPIRRTFSFHRDDIREIPVEIMVIRKKEL